MICFFSQPEIPPFGSGSKKKDEGGNKGTRRFATRRGANPTDSPASLTELSARYGEDKATAAGLTQSAPVILEVVPEAAAAAAAAVEAPAPVEEPVAVAKAVPAPAVAGPEGSGASGAPRKKVGKLNNQWAAKDAESASAVPSGALSPTGAPRPTGAKKIVVKAKRSATQLPSVTPGSVPSGLNSPKLPPVPPGPEVQEEERRVFSMCDFFFFFFFFFQGSTSPRRNSVSGPSPEEQKARPTSQTMRASAPTEPAKPVSQETLDELQKMNDRRTNIVREIYETEKSYVRNLKEICDLYIAPLKVCGKAKIGEKEGFLTFRGCFKESKWKDHVPKLFSNIHLIVAINDELLQGLAELIGAWDTTKSLVGPIFQKMAPFMRLYNTYGNSYNEAIALLQKLREKDDFTQFLNQCRGSQPLDLEVKREEEGKTNAFYS